MEEFFKTERVSLFNCDCRELLSTINTNSIDCIVTDPPYKMTSRGGTGTTGGMLKKSIVNKGKVFNFNSIKVKDYAPELFRVLKNGGHCYIMTNNVNLIEMLNVFTESGFHFIKSLIWDKQKKIMGTFYMSQFEYILFFRKGEGRKINNCGTPDILSIPISKTKDDKGNNLHDTEKPVELMKILIENSTNEGETVLEPFAGIGSTLMACNQLNRNCIASEIDLNYAEIIKNRFTGSNEKSDMLF